MGAAVTDTYRTGLGAPLRPIEPELEPLEDVDVPMEFYETPLTAEETAFWKEIYLRLISSHANSGKDCAGFADKAVRRLRRRTKR